MNSLKKITGLKKKKSETPTSGDSSAASSRPGNIDVYIGQSTARAKQILDAINIPISRVPFTPTSITRHTPSTTPTPITRPTPYTTPTPITRPTPSTTPTPITRPTPSIRSTPSSTPDHTPAPSPRMPPIIPPTLTPHSSSSAASSGPPPTLFMPHLIPVIPEVGAGESQRLLKITPQEAYIFEPWPENMVWRSCRISKTKLKEDLKKEAEGENMASGQEKKQKTCGTLKGLTVDIFVRNNGRHEISLDRNQRPKMGYTAVAAYTQNIGFVIRDRVPMLWPEWKDVPQCVKDALNNAMSVWFVVPSILLNNWCDEVQATKS
ncbi:hypothetical protein OROHE_022808 [Orobanche hederae]